MKYLVLLLFLSSLFLISCSTESLYEPGIKAPVGDVTIELNQIHYLNHLSEDYNLLKMYDTCYDSTLDATYGVGIMSDTVGYYTQYRAEFQEVLDSFEIK